MANEILKKEIKESEVKMWQIADKIGVSDMTLFRKFRYELTEAEKNEIMRIVSLIASTPAAHAKKSVII